MADTLAVNHPAQRLAGFGAQHSVSAAHYTTDAVRHGNETARSTATVATNTGAGAAAGWTSNQWGAIDDAVTNSLAGIKSGNTPAGFAQLFGSALRGSGGLFTNAQIAQLTQSYISVAGTPAGGIDQGKSASPFITAWDSGLHNLYGTVADPATTVTPAVTDPANAAATTPFSTLASLLSGFAAASPVTTAVPADSPGTSIPTTSSPSLVIPLLLVLLAIGVGWYWYTKHHHKKAAAA